MSKRSETTWKKVQEMVAAGETPVVVVSPSSEVKHKLQRGRTRVRNANRPYEHFAMHTPGGKSPMTCRNSGCKKKLKRDQRDIVCSNKCRAELRRICETFLSILNGETQPEDLPPQYRTHKTKFTL